MSKKVLILEDDQVAQRLWLYRINQLVPDAEVSMYPSVEHALIDLQSLANIEQLFDIFIVDIFLAGDKTGLEFVHQLPERLQRKTIITSAVSEENFRHVCKECQMKCLYIRKPLSQELAFNALIRVMNEDLCMLPYKYSKAKTTEGTKTNLKVELPVFLVTGCSSGVGAALAERLVNNQNYRVVLTARPQSIHVLKEKFSESDRVMILPLEITNISQIRTAVLAIIQKWGRIDVLINNAGVCYRSVMEQMDLDSEEVQMRTNYLGPMALIRAVVSIMREYGRGKIINVSSVSGILGMPTMGSYSASKHALEGASESLWYELKPLGINVTVVRPGFINNEGHTHIALASKARIAEKLNGPYSDFYAFMRPFVSKLMRISPSNSNSIADKIMQVIQTQNPPLWVNATADAHLFALLKLCLPEALFHKLMNLFFRHTAKWGNGYSRANERRLAA